MKLHNIAALSASVRTSALPSQSADFSVGAAETPGCLIVNADDWGRDRLTTDRTLECIALRTVSSVSAMVFMADSQRASAMAQESEIDAGLHLNFTTPFSASDCPALLLERQRQIGAYLRRHRLAQIIFNPGLVRSFEYVVATQLDEFRRLYGEEPKRFDGHHHMHLCANVVWGGLLPAGRLVRRNFSFQPGEKGLSNRLYRKVVDRRLAQRHRLVDFLFSLAPVEPADRLRRISSLARQHVVELETHPVNAEEHRFLTGKILRQLTNLPIATGFALPARRFVTKDAGA
jgi:chitin disaccharide deacetylase